jgi:hypothetical protein
MRSRFESEGYPQGEKHDERFFFEDRVESLLHDWKKIQDSLTEKDYADPKLFKGKELNKYRSAWFNAIIGVVSLMLEEKMITESEVEAEIKQKLISLTNEIAEVSKRKNQADHDIKMTDIQVAKGDELLRLVEPYAVRLEIDREENIAA